VQEEEASMIRRKFLQLIALSGASALAPLEVVAAKGKHKTAVFLVKGFSCITCAVGLDTMYSRTRGVATSHSTYPEGKVVVQFDSASIDESAVRAVILDAGFTIASEQLI
jgi:copper chaperone CopZ